VSICGGSVNEENDHCQQVESPYNQDQLVHHQGPLLVRRLRTSRTSTQSRVGKEKKKEKKKKEKKLLLKPIPCPGELKRFTLGSVKLNTTRNRIARQSYANVHTDTSPRKVQVKITMGNSRRKA
jgi:hypothetical protein